MTLVLLRDRDDEAEVGVDHPLLRRLVAALDPLRELDLLPGREERVAGHLVQEELERVRRRHRELLVEKGRLGPRAAAIVAELDPARVDLLVEALDLLVLELERLGEPLHLREPETAFLLAPLEQGRDLSRLAWRGHRPKRLARLRGGHPDALHLVLEPEPHLDHAISPIIAPLLFVATPSTSRRRGVQARSHRRRIVSRARVRRIGAHADLACGELRTRRQRQGVPAHPSSRRG